jgi:hypothetical protein
MKYLFFILLLLGAQSVIAATLTVKDVKVSVKSDSSGAAREKAIEDAHTLAFQKLIVENFPDQMIPLPSPEKLMNMVSTFSIDKEKTSAKSYAASITFKFDGNQVQSWVRKTKAPQQTLATEDDEDKPVGKQNKDTLSESMRVSEPLQVKVLYTSLPEWTKIKRTLEETQGVLNIQVLKLSAQNALLDIQYGGDIEKLRQVLAVHGISLSDSGEGLIVKTKDTLRNF